MRIGAGIGPNCLANCLEFAPRTADKKRGRSTHGLLGNQRRRQVAPVRRERRPEFIWGDAQHSQFVSFTSLTEYVSPLAEGGGLGMPAQDVMALLAVRTELERRPGCQ